MLGSNQTIADLIMRVCDLPVSYSAAVCLTLFLLCQKVRCKEIYIHTFLHLNCRRDLLESQDTFGCNCLCSAGLAECSLNTSSSCTGRQRRRRLLCNNRSTCHSTCKCYSLRDIRYNQCPFEWRLNPPGVNFDPVLSLEQYCCERSSCAMPVLANSERTTRLILKMIILGSFILSASAKRLAVIDLFSHIAAVGL